MGSGDLLTLALRGLEESRKFLAVVAELDYVPAAELERLNDEVMDVKMEIMRLLQKEGRTPAV